MSDDFTTVQKAVVATLRYAAELENSDYLRIVARDVGHMSPTEPQCALCGRTSCAGTVCPFAAVRPEHVCKVTPGSAVEYNGGNPVFLCGIDEGCRRILARAEYDEQTARYVPAEPPREEPEPDYPPGTRLRDRDGDVWTINADGLATLPAYTDPWAVSSVARAYGPLETVAQDDGPDDGIAVKVDAVAVRVSELADELAAMRERVNRIDARLTGIQEHNNLWDGS